MSFRARRNFLVRSVRPSAPCFSVRGTYKILRSSSSESWSMLKLCTSLYPSCWKGPYSSTSRFLTPSTITNRRRLSRYRFRTVLPLPVGPMVVRCSPGFHFQPAMNTSQRTNGGSGSPRRVVSVSAATLSRGRIGAKFRRGIDGALGGVGERGLCGGLGGVGIFGLAARWDPEPCPGRLRYRQVEPVHDRRDHIQEQRARDGDQADDPHHGVLADRGLLELRAQPRVVFGRDDQVAREIRGGGGEVIGAPLVVAHRADHRRLLQRLGEHVLELLEVDLLGRLGHLRRLGLPSRPFLRRSLRIALDRLLYRLAVAAVDDAGLALRPRDVLAFLLVLPPRV